MWGLFDIDQYVPKMYCLQSLKQMLLLISRLFFNKYQLPLSHLTAVHCSIKIYVILFKAMCAFSLTLSLLGFLVRRYSVKE